MESLVTTGEAAELLNLSVQGVHYRIKKNQLKSLKKDGKVYVYLDKSKYQTELKKEKTEDKEEKRYVIKLKDEQISLLKKYIKWMKKQYSGEIERLEKNQDKIISVFNREIKLLQQAFNEMRSIYKISHNNSLQSQDFEIMDLQDFFKFMKKHKKSDSEIKKIILQSIKRGDNRFIFDKIKKELYIYKSDFLDLI